MKIIVGLGNPDGKYNNTYHNLGFGVIDMFAAKNRLKFNKNKCHSKLAIGEGFVLAKPLTYMNNSGDAVEELKKYFKVSNNDILIVLDDIDLPKGKTRFRLAGSAGTHRGLRDIVDKVGQTPRIRIGAGRDNDMPLVDYVLSYIDPASKDLILPAQNNACELIYKFILGELCQDITL